MKIGLLTFHGAHNYGAILQAYATQEKIKELGFSIEVIDYTPYYLINRSFFALSSKNSTTLNLKLLVEGLITFPWKLKRSANFEKFINQKLQLSNKKHQNIPFSENNEYDLFIMGSDQIWNFKLTKGFDSVYLGNFKTKPTARKISYAASMSYYDLYISEKATFSKSLSNFNAISVREKELENLLSEEFQIASTLVLDPTFLLSMDKWKLISVKPKIKKRYLLVYAVGLQAETIKLADIIAKQLNLDIIELSMGVDKNALVNNYQKASPEEFVGLFEHADFILTSSFHGTTFSIIFNKPFYSIEQGNDKDSRQKTLLSNLGLFDRFIKHNDSLEYKLIDYTLVNSKLEFLLTESINFLKNNLNVDTYFLKNSATTVTIAITTYNASEFILETLESTYNQSYSDLALVISDDCSSDSTVAIVEDWVAQEKNKKRFINIEIITVPKNTGVSANCNRCIASVKTDWFKFISGDDILLPNCIEDNMNFVNENPQAKIIFSQVELYQDYFQEQNYMKRRPLDYPTNLMSLKYTASDQYKLLLFSDRINYTPSAFMNKAAIIKVGGYDESNRLVEDYPMWLKLTSLGERLFYFQKPTVGYRIHAKATNNIGQHVIFMPSILNTFAIRKRYAHPHLPWEIVVSEYQVYLVSKFFQQIGWNKKSKINNTVYRTFCFYFNPFYYLYSLKSKWMSNKDNLFYN